MPDQALNFSNAFLSVAGIFLGFSIAAFISVFVEFLNSLISFIEERNKKPNDTIEKIIKSWVLFFVLFVLAIFTGLLVFSVHKTLKVLQDGLVIGSNSADINNAIILYNYAVWGILIFLIIASICSLLSLILFQVWKKKVVKKMLSKKLTFVCKRGCSNKKRLSSFNRKSQKTNCR